MIDEFMISKKTGQSEVFKSKEEFMNRISEMIEKTTNAGGQYFEAEIDCKLSQREDF